MNKTVFPFRVFLTTLFFFSVSILFAQNGIIKGKVVDAQTNETLIGASVIIQGASIGTTADLDGNFTIFNAPAGTHTIVVSSIGYQPLTQSGIVVQSGKETVLKLLMSPDNIMLEAVEVVARVNRESEAVLLLEQRQALVATQSVGVRELSRKGIGDAQAAVAQVSGVSRQEGVKNVFVRGLGDRYNITLLNGFPIPSEDPEYKNVSLEFFGTGVIRNIGVSKVFSARDYSDVGGAVIDVSSKQLVGNYALGLDVSGGVNTAAIGTTGFLRQSGSNYFGFADKQQPAGNQFDFPNSLDPAVVPFPLNHGFGISGGKLFKLGEKQNPLSFFIVASHSTDYSFSDETVRNSTAEGLVLQDQTGEKYSQNTSQLLLGNAMYIMNNKHNVQYNFMLIHANDQYVGEFSGLNSNINNEYGQVFLRRQQTNDNLLIVNQFSSNWELTNRLLLDAGVSYNSVTGSEPDRRVNYLSMQQLGNYIFTADSRQKRFYSELTGSDFNAKADLTFKLRDRFGSPNSALRIGYAGRFAGDSFEAIEYSFDPASGKVDMNDLRLDDFYNRQAQLNGNFRMKTGELNTYSVTKQINSVYAEASYQLFQNLSGNIGVRMDRIDMTVDYSVQTVPSGSQSIQKNYFLPSLNLKYDVNPKNSLRLGVSKTYTLPQSKEITPYQYVNISFVSEGNPDLKPSENYNVDLKWDYYFSSGELLSLTVFYKQVLNPIGRVDIGGSAGILSYDNISDQAAVCGVEMEMRKNLFGRFDTERELTKKLSIGLNASYIYTNLKLDVINTAPRNSEIEGASPFLGNVDISYNYTKQDKSLTAALVFSYFSDRIYTLGARGLKNTMEEGAPALNFAASYKFNKHISLKVKAANLLNPSFRLTRETTSGEKITLNEYKKGQNISLGIGYEF